MSEQMTLQKQANFILFRKSLFSEFAEFKFKQLEEMVLYVHEGERKRGREKSRLSSSLYSIDLNEKWFFSGQKLLIHGFRQMLLGTFYSEVVDLKKKKGNKKLTKVGNTKSKK